MAAPISQIFSDYWALALKLVSVMIAGTLGTIGLLNDFKDKEGNLTKWGRVTLLGLVVSSMVGIGSELYDSHKKKRDETDQKNQALHQLELAGQQLEFAATTIGQVQEVLKTSREVQKMSGEALSKQGELMRSNKANYHEISRGLTPFGSDVKLDYELAASTHSWQFPQLKEQLDQQIKAFMAELPEPPKPHLKRGYKVGDPYSYPYTPDDRKGVELTIEVQRDGTQSLSELSFGPHPPLRLTGKAWDAQLFGGAVRSVRIWKTPPPSPSCRPAIDPDLVLSPDLSDNAWTLNFYVPGEGRIEQHASLHLHKGLDDGAVISTLDLANALLELSFVVPSADVTRELRFCKLTISVGHLTIAIDPKRLTQCESSLLVRLPSTFSLGGEKVDQFYSKDDLCK